jgi:hypothetical protein
MSVNRTIAISPKRTIEAVPCVEFILPAEAMPPWRNFEPLVTAKL